MRKKYPSADEIQIEIFPKNKPNKLFHITYVKHKKKPKYKKSVNLKYKRKIKEKPIIFNLAGVAHSVNTKAKLEQFRLGVDHGTQLNIKHEYRNRFDENACAVYFKNLKIGYVPKTLNSQFIDNALAKKYFTFVSCFSPLLIDFSESNIYSFPIIAIPCK